MGRECGCGMREVLCRLVGGGGGKEEICREGMSVEERCGRRKECRGEMWEKEGVEERCGRRKEWRRGVGEGFSVEERCGRRNECGGEVWEKEGV